MNYEGENKMNSLALNNCFRMKNTYKEGSSPTKSELQQRDSALLGPIPPKSRHPNTPAAASGIAQTIPSRAEVTNQQISKQGRRLAGDQTGIIGEKPPNSER